MQILNFYRHTFIREQISERAVRSAIKEHIDRHRKVLRKGFLIKFILLIFS
jgi:hypothetical protein